MSDLNIEKMSLQDLVALESIFKRGLDREADLVRKSLGLDYDTTRRLEDVYRKHHYHAKLKRVKDRIQQYIDAI